MGVRFGSMDARHVLHGEQRHTPPYIGPVRFFVIIPPPPPQGGAPLYLAALNGHVQAVLLLLAGKADTAACNEVRASVSAAA